MNLINHRIGAGQRGAALFISLMFLIILTLIGLSAANVGIMQERMAGNVQQSNLAFQRAEATLRGIEQRVQEISAGGSGGLGQIPIWAEITKPKPQGLGITRGDCALSGAPIDEWDWGGSPDVNEGNAEYMIAELSGASTGGDVFGSSCRPMQSEHAGNPGQSAVYYLIGARAEGEDETAEAVVQSIFFYP